MGKKRVGISVKNGAIISVIVIAILILINIITQISSTYVKIDSAGHEDYKKAIEQQTTVPDGYTGIYNVTDLQNMALDLRRKLYIDGGY